MKIAILTQPLGRNYGGLLQAYALQTYLESKGCEVVVIDRQPAVRHWLNIIDLSKNILRYFVGRIKTIPTDKKYSYIFKELYRFKNQYINLSDKINSERSIRKYFAKNDFNVVVVGSDQVWRPMYSPSILNFYLNFLDDVKKPMRRVSYGASFGVDAWEYSKSLTVKCAELANKFDAVSVREDSAVRLSEEKLGIQAQLVVDPTLLLDVHDFENLIGDCESEVYKGCVLSYVLDPRSEKQSIAWDVGNAQNKEVTSIKPEIMIQQTISSQINKCVNPGVESWLGAFRSASYVVTDSFHGTVFAILFNKPFISIGNSERGMARFVSLLTQFNLEDRLVETRSDVTNLLINQAIDWDYVNDTRKELASTGKKFICKNILDTSNE